VSSDPADVFIALFDQVPETLFLGDEADLLEAMPSVKLAADEVYRAVLSTGQAAPSLANLPSGDERNTTAMARLIGLDQVLRWAHPNSGSPAPPSLARLVTRYARHGRFNSSLDSGLLIPRLVDYGAVHHRADKYERFSVVRLETDRMKYVDFRSFGSRGWPTLKGTEDLVVACLPFLDTVDDIVLERFQKFGRSWYQLGPSDTDILRARVDQAIEAFDSSGAMVGLLPECALSGPLLELWQQRLASTYPTARTNVALVVAGTGPVTAEVPPRNRAVVLDRQGAEVWSQDKLCDYTIDEKTWSAWKLSPPATGETQEYITRGDVLIVAETTMGRIGILICEDLQRCATRRVVPRDLGVSHLFVPVFDKPLGNHRWHRFAADEYMQWIGSRVVVSNSRVVGNLLRNPADPPGIPTAFGISPPRDPKTGEYQGETKDTNSAFEAVTIRMPALGPVP
jgi:hypothetical protein